MPPETRPTVHECGLTTTPGYSRDDRPEARLRARGRRRPAGVLRPVAHGEEARDGQERGDRADRDEPPAPADLLDQQGERRSCPRAPRSSPRSGPPPETVPNSPVANHSEASRSPAMRITRRRGPRAGAASTPKPGASRRARARAHAEPARLSVAARGNRRGYRPAAPWRRIRIDHGPARPGTSRPCARPRSARDAPGSDAGC